MPEKFGHFFRACLRREAARSGATRAIGKPLTPRKRAGSSQMSREHRLFGKENVWRRFAEARSAARFCEASPNGS